MSGGIDEMLLSMREGEDVMIKRRKDRISIRAREYTPDAVGFREITYEVSDLELRMAQIDGGVAAIKLAKALAALR